MSKVTKIIFWIVVIVLIIWGVTAVVKNNQVTDEPIKFGFIGPLSGDGATYGESARNGMAVAIDEINNAGGINGRKVEVIYEDGKCTGKDATSAAQKLVSIDKVPVIVGLPCSGEVLAAAPITEPAKVILLVQGSNPDISNAGEYIFRTFPSDNRTSVELSSRIVNKDNYKKVAIITENTEYAVGLQKGFNVEVEKIGGKIVASENYNSDAKDFRTILLKIKSANPEALFINAQVGANAVRIAKQTRELGIKSQFYTAFFSGDEFVKADKAVEGTIIIDAPTLDQNNPLAQQFLKSYRAKFNSEPSYPFFSGGSYEETRLIGELISKVGLDTEKLKQELYQINNRQSLLGDFSFDQNGDEVGIGLRFLKVQNGLAVDAK